MISRVFLFRAVIVRCWDTGLHLRLIPGALLVMSAVLLLVTCRSFQEDGLWAATAAG
jgi:hypothetical protein